MFAHTDLCTIVYEFCLHFINDNFGTSVTVIDKFVLATSSKQTNQFFQGLNLAIYSKLKIQSCHFYSKIEIFYTNIHTCALQRIYDKERARFQVRLPIFGQRHFGQRHFGQRLFGQRHFGQRDNFSSVTLTGDTLTSDALARVTLWPETLWPE